MRIRWPDFPNSLEFDVHIFGPVQVSLDSIIGFNNTGNIRIWPSEECLGMDMWKKFMLICSLFPAKKSIEDQWENCARTWCWHDRFGRTCCFKFCLTCAPFRRK